MKRPRRRRKGATRTRRRSVVPRARARRTRRRGTGGGGVKQMLPTLAVSAAIGWVEGKAKADPTFIANKIPRFIDQIGWLGNTALALYVANRFILRNRWLGLAAQEAARIAAYQLGRKGGLFGQSGEFFTVTGWSDSDVSRVIDQYSAGALSADGMPGVPAYDPSELQQFGEYGG